MEAERHEQIRQRAHTIWEQEGRPHGREQEHWERAERELGLGTESLTTAAVKKKAPSLRGAKAPGMKAAAPKKARTAKA
jgi:hypothetical protein